MATLCVDIDGLPVGFAQQVGAVRDGVGVPARGRLAAQRGGVDAYLVEACGAAFGDGGACVKMTFSWRMPSMTQLAFES